MSSAPKYIPHYTIDDYRLWEGDWELWDGIAVAMTPSAFGGHGSLHGQITNALINAIDANDCSASVLLEIDWNISEDTVVRPDVSVVCGPPPEKHIVDTPALVVEIHSESTRNRDETIKRDLYQQRGVGWYLMLDPESQQIKILKLSSGGEYEAVDPADRVVIDICGDCSLDVRLDRLFR